MATDIGIDVPAIRVDHGEVAADRQKRMTGRIAALEAKIANLKGRPPRQSPKGNRLSTGGPGQSPGPFFIASYRMIARLRQNPYLSHMENRVHRMLQNLNVLPELGRQRCFELGNPFYYKDSSDRNIPGNEKGRYYRKELPGGEIYLVELDIVRGQGQTYQFNDKVIRRIQ